jgi:DNA polymerase (family 10)
MAKKAYFDNLSITDLLRKVAIALELLAKTPVDRFRFIAYQKAADTIEHSSAQVFDLWQAGHLDTLPGVGKNIQAHLDELFRTGKVQSFITLLKTYPEAVYELVKIPGVGPIIALKLAMNLGLNKKHSALTGLEKAIAKNRVAKIEGLGEGYQAKIALGVEHLKKQSKRLLLHQAESVAESLIDWLKKVEALETIYPLGSLRRKNSTVGDIDLAAISDQPEKIVERFVVYPGVWKIINQGDAKASVVLTSGIRVDLMVADKTSFGSLLLHFTGSKLHNIALREHALSLGYSLSEQGVKKLKNSKTQKLEVFSTEEELYNFLGLDWIPPELREGKDEIELAKRHKLPQLVEINDIKGDLHTHSDFQTHNNHDLGKNSMLEMATVAKDLSYTYLACTEHNPDQKTNNKQQITGMLRNKYQEAKKVSEKVGIKVFSGLEVDILADGTLAFDPSLLEHVDFLIASIHSSFRQSKPIMTERLLKALSFSKVKILGHPTGRLINERDEIDADWPEVFKYCAEHNIVLEIDAWPNRLDLSEHLLIMARNFGCHFVIDSDAHTKTQLLYMKYGVYVARRAGLTKDAMINTQELTTFEKWLCQN